MASEEQQQKIFKLYLTREKVEFQEELTRVVNLLAY